MDPSLFSTMPEEFEHQADTCLAALTAEERSDYLWMVGIEAFRVDASRERKTIALKYWNKWWTGLTDEERKSIRERIETRDWEQ